LGQIWYESTSCNWPKPLKDTSRDCWTRGRNILTSDNSVL